jgi:hypothetical protein
MNRNKTKKWVDAKSYAYDGDDWGDYDQDDEYGADAQQEQSNTQPKLARSSSFERGDEKSTFSATTPLAATSGPNALNQGANRAVSGQTIASDASSAVPEHRRDFSPSAMPQPLSTSRQNAGSPAPSETAQVRPPSAAGAYDPRETSTAQPFVRPADIYKRIEEARSKEALAKASNDNLRQDSALAPKTSLANIPERKSEYGVPVAKEAQPSTDKYRLPDVASDSSFGDEMFSPSAAKSTSDVKAEPVKSPVSTNSGTLDPLSPGDGPPSRAPSQGFKSMVNRAFEPSELLGVSKQDSVRSQRTDGSRGTSDISPILASVRESGDHTTENILNLYSDDEPYGPNVHDTPKASTNKASEQSDLGSSEATLVQDKSATKSFYSGNQPPVTTAELKAVIQEKALPVPEEKALPVPEEKAPAVPEEKSLPSRPKIPGQFDSYAFASSVEPTPLNELPGAKYFTQVSKETEEAKTPEVPDFSPSTTSKPPPGAPSPSNMAELSVAGAAMGAAIEQAFRVEPPKHINAGSARAVDIPSSKPPTPPAKDQSPPLTPDLAPPVPLKTTKAPTSDPPSGAVLQSTAIAPNVATAQSTIAPPSNVVVPSKTETSSQPVAALPPIYTSMLDVGPPKKSMLDVGESKKSTLVVGEPKKSIPDVEEHNKEIIVSPLSGKPVEDDRASIPKISRQFSWETDTPSASDAPVLSPGGTGLKIDHPIGEHSESLSQTVSPLGPDFSLDHEKEIGTTAAAVGPTSHTPAQYDDEIRTSNAGESHPTRQSNEKNERLPSFREIMAIKSTPERIAAYDETREEWLHMDAGLSQWLATTIDKYPEHGLLRAQTAKPFDGPSLLANAGSSKRSHMRIGSIGSIGKVFTSGGGSSSYNPELSSPERDKRTSGGAIGGAGKAVGDTLKGLGGKSKGLIGKIKASRKKEDDGY